jgi:hypothetical protein
MLGQTVEHQPTYPDASGWYPRDASKLPFGSALWWDQMMREGRLKRNCGDKQFTWRGRPILRIVYCFGCRRFYPASLYLPRAWVRIAVRHPLKDVCVCARAPFSRPKCPAKVRLAKTARSSAFHCKKHPRARAR